MPTSLAQTNNACVMGVRTDCLQTLHHFDVSSIQWAIPDCFKIDNLLCTIEL